LLDAIQNAIERDSEALKHRYEASELRSRYETLSPREREVMGLVIRGLLNKQAAVEGSVCCLLSRVSCWLIAALAQSQLVAFQFYRVLGVTFLVLYAAGQLPGILALPAGWGDVMVDLTALMVGARAARNENDQLVILSQPAHLAPLIM